MVTITLSVDDCAYWEWEIRNAIHQVPGAEYAVVQVSDEEEDDKVVVSGVNAAIGSELAVQIYIKVGLRACVVSIVEDEGLRVTVEDEDDEDEEEDDEEDEDEDDDEKEEEGEDDGEDDDNDNDEEAEDDDDTYIEMSSLSLYPPAAIDEPESLQPVADPTPVFHQYFIF